MYSSGLAPDDKVYCKHMEEAAKRKSNTPKHPNRDFYCCKRPQSDKTKCKFWYWADQVPRAIVHGASTARSPPRTSREGPTTPPTRPPPQKHFSPMHGPSAPETPRSKKRLEGIEAGLKQREQDFSPIRYLGPLNDEELGSSTSRPAVEVIPQPPSPVPTEIDDEVETRPRRSFLGLDCGPEPIISTIKVEDQPSTPKKRRLIPHTEGTVTPPAAETLPLGGGLPLTPPQTTRRIAQVEGPEAPPVMARSRKGKEREGAPPVRTQNQDDRGGCPKEDSLPLFTHPEDTISTFSASPTTAENVLDYTDGMKARVKALSEYMGSFDITQAARFLQTIERQKIQYECRDRSQKARIEELVAEKEELVVEVARLREALERCEESNRINSQDAEIAGLKGWDYD